MNRFLVAIAICLPLQAQFLSNNVIATNRAWDWTRAGIPGGLPDASWAQCGATLTSSATAAQIAGALNHTGSGYTSCTPPYYIQLAAGTYNLSAGVCVTVSNVALRGAGANSTKLIFSGSSTCGGLGVLLGSATSDSSCFYGCSGQTVYTWTAGYAQGATSITLSSVANIATVSTGNPTLILMNQNDSGYSGWTLGSPSTGSSVDNGSYFGCADQYSATGPTGCAYNGPESAGAGTGSDLLHRWQYEIETATAANSATGVVTLSQPLKHPNWTSAQSPIAWIVQSIAQVGFENLLVDATSAGSVFAGVAFEGCYQCWMSGVQIQNFQNFAFDQELSTHSTLKDNYIYKSTGADSYGFRFGQINSDNLVQNNIIQQVSAPVVFDGPSSGDVVAYNYAINDSAPSDGLSLAFWAHSMGDDFQLFEGNVSPGFDIDIYHGTHLDETIFRNLALGWDSCANSQCGADTFKDSGTTAIFQGAYNRYANLIGNVLGTPGYTTTYTSGAPCNACSVSLGGGDNGQPPNDPLTATTSMRWGNWDVVTNAVRWCGNSSDTGWSTTCSGTSEIPTGLSAYANSVPTLGDTAAGQGALPASFYLAAKPSWFGSTPFPAIGPDVSNGTVGQCSGTLNTAGGYSGLPATSSANCVSTSLASAWGGHVNATPAMNCALNVMGMPPDGTGAAVTFNAASCYSSTGTIQLTPPVPTSAPVN